ALAVVSRLRHPVIVRIRPSRNQIHQVIWRQAGEIRHVLVAIPALIPPQTTEARHWIAHGKQCLAPRSDRFIWREEFGAIECSREDVPIGHILSNAERRSIQRSAPALRRRTDKCSVRNEPARWLHQYFSALRASASCSAVTLQWFGSQK